MPDVTRSDSQRSDASLRPRVSFNRDVHVKRIVPNEASRVAGALSGDGAGHLLPSPVRKERLPKSKQQLAEEAAKVLQEVDKIDCFSQNRGGNPDKFYTLPTRRKHKINADSPQSSIERKTRRRKSEELGVTIESPPKKPPRTFAHYPKSEKLQRSSIFNIFKKSEKEPPEAPKKSNLRRSVSDATNLKSKAFGPVDDAKPVRKRAGSDSEDNSFNVKNDKKQLSPIIEVTQREDYFSHNNKENIHAGERKENVERVTESIKRKKESKGEAKPNKPNKPNKNESVTEKLKEYIDEVDTAIFNETGVKVNYSKNEKKIPEIVIIDVDKAEKISNKKEKSGTIGKKFKLLSNKKDKKDKKDKKEKVKKPKGKTKTKEKEPANVNQKGVLKTDKKLENFNSINRKEQVKKVELIKIPDTHSPAPKIKEVIDNLKTKGSRSPKMIHSSQQPAQKLPLTRGLTVDTMVKRLNNDKTSPPPPKTNIMVTPHVTVQHNNNQPFSYTRGLSPERNYTSPDGSRSPVNPSSPVIYAHVVCDKGGLSNSGPTKQTIHTTYTNGKKHLPHSDSDEGLGNEENSAFNRTKYGAEKTITHFGDERYINERNGFNGNRPSDDFYKDPNQFEEEYPITPKFKNVGYNGFNEYTKTQHSIFVDSSSRGRGDGMDSKRRESLTEPHENGFVSQKYNINSSRTDLSARRDLLESRINRRLGDKSYRQSPPSNSSPYNGNAKYISESTSRYYRHGSASPVGFTEMYVSESKTDKNGERYTTESRVRKNIGENDRIGHNNRYKLNEYRYNNYDTEPKSFDSQASDYRSSPENVARRIDASHEYRYTHSNKYMSRDDKQKLVNDREHYKSNPEIIQRTYDDSYKYDQETYHDSLKREKHEARLNSAAKYRPERYFDQNECERKDKLGDSGIENDFKRDSGDHFRTPRSSTQRREYCNESEDEGFASSLLIASERQHTEDNINNRKMRRDYDSDRGYREDRDREREDSYRNVENMEYKIRRDYKSKDRHEYAPRERSIDDGSHYDPRIDKDFEPDRSTLKKKVDKKPPKPEKKSGLEKVKQLFSRDSSKKNKKEKERAMVPEENLRARYTEYKGSREHLEPKAIRKSANEVKTSYDYSSRRRLSTPSPSPTREVQRNEKSETTHGSWFKSLDRLSRKKSKKDEKDATSEEEIPPKPTPAKNLRFFGDTDIESNDSLRHKSSIKTRPLLSDSNHHDRTRSQSTRELHNISEERRNPEFITPTKSNNHKSLLNVSESEREIKGSRLSLKPPMSPNHRITREVSRGREDRGRRRRNEVSSVESSTEGDSSQQSQRSVVYLHAATVGDIPGPGYLRGGRRAASREELTSNGSSNIRPQAKTLSRSFSVLAPWRPRHHKEGYDIDYTQYPKPKNGKYEQKVTKNGNSRKDNSSTLKKKANETRRSNQNISTLNRKSRSKENLSSQTLKKSKEDITKGSSSTLYKKKERQPKENTRYNRDREERRISSKSMSVESLGNGRAERRNRDESRDVSRSISMPRDPEKSAGWFKMNKKSKKSLSTQRL